MIHSGLSPSRLFDSVSCMCTAWLRFFEEQWNMHTTVLCAWFKVSRCIPCKLGINGTFVINKVEFSWFTPTVVA